MFKRRDIPPVLLLLLLIILVMLTLSQILVVHNGRYGRNVHNMRKLQLELREMDVNLHALMMQNVPSIELNRRMLQNKINAQRFADIISQASQIDPVKDGVDLPSSRLRHNRSAANTPSVLLYEDVNLDHGDIMDSDIDLTSGPTHIHPVSKDKNKAITSNGHQSRSLTGSETIPTKDSANHPSGYHSHNDTPHGPAGLSETTNTLNYQLPSPNKPKDFQHSWDQSKSGQTLKDQRNGRSKHGNRPVSSPKVTYCPAIPPNLKGHIGVNLTDAAELTWEDIAVTNPAVLSGGTWAPKECVARHRVAIIIPYRDREEHLITLLYHLHPILQRQQLDYRIYVVEQYGKDTFNKARIMNIAFIEGLKKHPFQCFVFHDVDLVPEDDTNMYSCPLQPRHMSVAIDEMGYKLAYQELVGGVLNMRTEHFQRVNGYSNLYWGWGAEDDDMAYRIMHVGLKITRPPESSARYKMAKHTKRKPSDWRKRAKLLYTGTRRFQFDGLNSLQYKVIHLEHKPLYTHMLVDIGKPPRGF